MENREILRALAQQLRVDSVRCSAAAGSGHPTSAMSAADLMAVLLSEYLNYDFNNAGSVANDHLVFSKGHASPLLYSMFKAAGAISDEELLTFRKFDSRLQGHPTPSIPWVDVATGSLGQGLPIGVGIALAGKYLDRVSSRVWVLCGDSEMAEGSMWEAFERGAFLKLDNLTAIIDVNRLGQRGQTMYGWDLSKLSQRARSFGWNAIEIDGHDVREIDEAYHAALSVKGQPTVIVARTVKGKGVAFVENKEGQHGKSLSNTTAAIQELGGLRDIKVNVNVSTDVEIAHQFETNEKSKPVYIKGDLVATRRAYGDALAVLGSVNSDVVVLDSEVSNSTYSDAFVEACPDRFFEMYIAEQQMVATAIGIQVRGWVPFASTFAAFLTRAYDFVRMAAVSQANIRLVGSHAGVSIGEDGPSQMGLEDIASMRAIHGSTVLYPSDANQSTYLVSEMYARTGVVYMRTTREATPVIYDSNEEFPIGGSRVMRVTDHDMVTLVAAGITLHEALKAAVLLEASDIFARVIDLYSVKPIDERTLIEAGEATGKIITIEDHWSEGGIGDAVLQVFSNSGLRPQIVKLAVTDMPTSGTPQQLLHSAGIDAEHIVSAAKELVIQ